MNDKRYLNFCLEAIVQKLQWGDASTWKNKDYIKLSKLVSEASQITISSHTLKRLFGKLSYAQSYNPQQATKDALAIFLGYTNWDDFIDNNTNIQHTQTTQNQRKKPLLKYFILAGLGLVILFVFLFNLSDKEANLSNTIFNIKDSIGASPHTVSINYDVSKIKSDSIYINYDFINPNRGLQKFRLDKTKTLNNFTYQIPGYYTIGLEVDGKQVKTKKALILSEDWDTHIFPENKSREFWINNKVEANFEDGFRYFSPDTLKAKGFNTPVFYVANRLYKRFNIDGDNFELKAKFKNTKALGGITCYDFILKLHFTKETNHFVFVEEGCSRFSGIKIGEKDINGKDTDLSNFKISTTDWNLLKITIENKKAKVYINHNLIFEDSYNNSNGSLVGLENYFKGSGMLDFLKIKDLKSGTVFFDDFIATP